MNSRMRLEVAKPSDNQTILEFYKGFPLKGVLELKVDRRGDFFGPYAVESDRFRTYLLKDDQDHLQGMASFTIKDVMINGQIKTVAYGRDLRISNNRRAIIEWADHFVPTLQDISNTYGVQHFFSALNMTETSALNTFVRPRNLKRALPRYFNYRRFNLVSVHGRFPWAQNPLPHLQIRNGSSVNADALIYYLSQKSIQRNLSTYWDSYSFFKQLHRWRGLRLEDFLVAFDRHNNIVGCCAPWKADGIQELVPLDYSLKAHNFRQFLKFGKLFGWTRNLTKPAYRLQLEETLQFQYLTHLFADNEDVFESLLWAAYDRARSNDFLIYPQTREELIYKRPLNWVCAKIPHGLYCMVPPDQNAPDFLNPSNDIAVSLEAFFI
ncbi:hypothetical protein [Bdellovibrio sp. HCB337]|uniref:hypothetical protein n=1 Tax=Bdellovibrio sp. HCB337 TaxID=3394358 RepID=UPI0039A65239